MSGSYGRTGFQLGYQISPIILTGGIASDIPGKLLPIISITEGIGFLQSILNGNIPDDIDGYFAQFRISPGSTLANNKIGHYPFANQQVAANAIIAQPLTVSLVMTCPVNSAGGYVTKLASITAIQSALASHDASGGLYTIVTPGYVYTNCIRTAMTDISSGESNQVQFQYQLDFEQPLVSLAAATQAYNSLLSKVDNGSMIANPTWSGLAQSVGSQISGVGSSIVTGAQNLLGSSVLNASSIPVIGNSL